MWIEEGARGSEVGQKDGEAFATVGAEGGQASVGAVVHMSVVHMRICLVIYTLPRLLSSRL